MKKWKNIWYIILVIFLWIILIWNIITFHPFKKSGLSSTNFTSNIQIGSVGDNVTDTINVCTENSSTTDKICIDQSWLYEINGYASFGNNTQYLLSRAWNSYIQSPSTDDAITFTVNYSLWLSNTEYGWLDSLYTFRKYVYLDLKFSNWKIVDRKVVDNKNEKELWNPENINWASVVWERNIKYYSKLNKWDSINLTDTTFLYNDTDEIQTFIIVDTRWKEKENKINAWEFYNATNSFWETIKI